MNEKNESIIHVRQTQSNIKPTQNNVCAVSSPETSACGVECSMSKSSPCSEHAH